MGKMIDGEWTTEWYHPDDEGRFQREETVFHDRVTADGSSGFAPEAGRYHLYVSLACPWAHRTLVMRRLKGLEDAIGVTVVDPHMGEDGWAFSDAPGCQPDPLFGKRFLREVYTEADPRYTGRVTVPILWDKERGTLVNNESREILRMLDTAFDAVAKRPERTYWPKTMRENVDRVIDAIYEPVNNGVYRAGFAESQGAYEEAVVALFDALDRWDRVLGDQRFLCGDRLTEADVCMFTTLFRFDPVYYVHFKCNLRRIDDYPNLSGYLRDVYQTPGVAETCDLGHIKAHYYWSHPHINPTRIVPRGPIRDLDAPHGRG